METVLLWISLSCCLHLSVFLLLDIDCCFCSMCAIEVDFFCCTWCLLIADLLFWFLLYNGFCFFPIAIAIVVLFLFFCKQPHLDCWFFSHLWLGKDWFLFCLPGWRSQISSPHLTSSLCCLLWKNNCFSFATFMTEPDATDVDNSNDWATGDPKTISWGSCCTGGCCCCCRKGGCSCCRWSLSIGQQWGWRWHGRWLLRWLEQWFIYIIMITKQTTTTTQRRRQPKQMTVASATPKPPKKGHIDSINSICFSSFCKHP